MKRILLSAILGFAVAIAAGGVAQAAEYDQYRIESAGFAVSDPQAGAHADLITDVEMSAKEGVAYAKTRDVVVELPPGIGGNPEAFPKCTALQLGNDPQFSECPFDTQVGSIDLTLSGLLNGTIENSPIYNMPAPGGDVVARFGFYAAYFPVFINIRLNPETRSLVAYVEGSASAVELISASTTFWGVPASPVHDDERITPDEAVKGNAPVGGRESTLPETPFMTNPTSCDKAREGRITATSYQIPDAPSSITVPFPQISGCGALEFSPSTEVKPTTAQGTSGSGLDYELSLPTKGLEFANLFGGSHLRRAEVVLPEGMTVNPSQAEGLGVCSEADLARETYNSAPNVGCPESSKIGSVEAITPVIDRNPTGSLYVAKPYENRFGSLLAIYMVLKVPDRGVLVKQAGEVSLDPRTGQIKTVVEDLPELPFKTFRLHFREGARAPLVTPPACGSYAATSTLSPHSAPQKPVVNFDSFGIESGPDRGPCPSGGLPPFKPGLLAYSVNQAAGGFSPFYLRMSRSDSEQEITRFSIKLPPGLAAKLAGVPFCPEAAIAAAKARTGIHGGAEELAAPSCPAASEIGTSLAGAGVGTALTYVAGKVYLAGPYNGSALSVVSVTAAKAGPFDLGTVVVREALRVNPETAEVFVDATGSDPIPHIILGVPVHLRDIRVNVDRPQFALNPTDCTRTSTASTLLGAGLDFASEADDRPFTVTSPFQAADCAALAFKPKLSLRLRGGTRRGANPALRATLRAGGIGTAGIERAQVTLPNSEFLEQAHIRTICTRVQFRLGQVPGERCPAASIYGKAKAVTPLLDEPLTGPVFLRSSEHPLPDVVASLHSGKIDIVLVGRIDSVKGGGIRTTFEGLPDAPVTSFVLEMAGGNKGLLVNSTNVCKGTHRAKIAFGAQNGKRQSYKSALKASCGGKGKRQRKQR